MNDDTIEKILYGRRMAWDIAGCAAHAGIRRGQLSKCLNVGSEMRHALDSGATRIMPRKGSKGRRYLDLWDAWERDGTHAERRLQAIAQRTAEGHWTPDHRWENVVGDDGRPLLGRDGRPLRKRVRVEPKYIAPDARIALDMLERLFPHRWKKSPASVVNVGHSSGQGNVVFPFIDLSDATPEQLHALTHNIDPEQVFSEDE